MLQVQSLISFLAAAPKVCGSSWAHLVVQREHVGSCRWLCLCCEYLFENWCGDRKEIFCSTYWDKLCKVQVIFTLLFSPQPHSFDFYSIVSSSLISAEYGSGHTNGYWCVLRNEAEDEFCPYVLIPHFYNKTPSVMSRKKMKNASCGLLWIQIATWTLGICSCYTSTSVMPFWSSISDSCCLIAVHLPTNNVFI